MANPLEKDWPSSLLFCRSVEDDVQRDHHYGQGGPQTYHQGGGVALDRLRDVMALTLPVEQRHRHHHGGQHDEQQEREHHET